MKTLIVYGSKYGCTEKCAASLARKLDGMVDLLNLKEKAIPDLSQYEKVIIGGSIYIGKIRKEVSEFSAKHLDRLKDKKIGLFICGMRDGDMAAEEINSSFPKELLTKAAAKECFGGEFIFSKMNFMERLITKKVANIDKDTSNVSEESIDRFAQLMNKA